MKLIIIILIMQFYLLFSSSLELHGTGERFHGFNAMEIGLGDSYFFSDHKSKFNGTSIADVSGTGEVPAGKNYTCVGPVTISDNLNIKGNMTVFNRVNITSTVNVTGNLIAR